MDETNRETQMRTYGQNDSTQQTSHALSERTQKSHTAFELKQFKC